MSKLANKKALHEIKENGKMLPQIGKTATVQSVFRTAKILKCLANNVGSIKDISKNAVLV